MANLSVEVAGVTLKNPIIPASGDSDMEESMSSCFRFLCSAVLQLKEQQDSLVPEIRHLVLQKPQGVC